MKLVSQTKSNIFFCFYNLYVTVNDKINFKPCFGVQSSSPQCIWCELELQTVLKLLIWQYFKKVNLFYYETTFALKHTDNIAFIPCALFGKLLVKEKSFFFKNFY